MPAERAVYQDDPRGVSTRSGSTYGSSRPTQLVGEVEAQAGLWAKHQQIATYIAAVRDAYAGEPHLMAPDQPLGRWLTWADAHVAQMDPRRHRKLAPENPPLVRQPRPFRW